MRCLIFICLCLAVASATSWNTRRFNRLLHEFQTPSWNRPTWNTYDNTDDMWSGLDEMDDDYVDNIRSKKYYTPECGMYGNQQCSTMMDWDDEMQGTQFDHVTPFDSMSDFENVDDMDNIYDPTFGGLPTSKKSILSTRLGIQVARELEEANTKLASRLYEQCKEERDDKNTVVSPISIQLGLSALNQGARGETRRQIAKIIAGRLPLEQRKQVFKTIARSLKTLRTGGYSNWMQGTTQINCVTGIFISKMTPAQQQWIQWIQMSLGVSVQKCNFHSQPQQCRRMINQWVSQKTHNKMPRIVPEDAVTDNTKMILVNALQLKANWGQQMRKHITKPSPFFPLESEKVKIVEMLKTRGVFKYYEDELVKIVGVPTERKELTLYVIVPKDKDGLTHVEKIHLKDGVQLKQLLDDTDKRVKRVHVELPKFEIKHKVDVRRTLRKQGVVDAFDCKRADFSGITGSSKYGSEMYGERENEYESESWKYSGMNDEFETMKYGRGYPQNDMEDMMDISRNEKNLHLNKFIHQATIKITENGITTATGMDTPFQGSMYDEERMTSGSWRTRWNKHEMFEDIIGYGNPSTTNSQYYVKADRAFAFVLKHNPTQQLLLVGRVIDAAQKQRQGVSLTINAVDQF
jgi:serine protease inhibitor